MKKIALDLDGVVFDSENLYRVYTEMYDVDVLKRDSLIDNSKRTFQKRYKWSDEEIQDFCDKNVKEIIDKYNVAILNNYVPDTIYDEFINKMGNVNIDILERISEIEYRPNDVDTKRFYLLMDDGNIVYLTLDDFLKINSYIETIKTLDGNKGTLYLDSGNYFEVR